MLTVVMRGLVQESLNTGLREAPSTSIERLFLSPDNGLGVGVHVEILLQLLPREGVQLLNTSKGNVVDFVLSTVLVESSPDLTSAENDTVNLLWSLDSTSLVFWVRDDPLETSILADELINVRTCQGVTEQRF